MPTLDRELRLLRAYALLTYPFVCVPFLYLYFRHNGVTLADYGTVVAVYYAAMFVADVPTSVIADRLGQRGMLVLGPLLLAMGFGLLAIWRTFAGFCAGEALMGLGHSVLSGPPSAMLYELLRRHDQQHRYLHEEARIHALRLVGTGGSFLLGGLIAFGFGDDAGPAYAATIAPTAALCAAAGAVALGLRPLPPPARLRLSAFARAALSDLMRRDVRWLLAYWIVLFALLRYPFHNYQVYLDEAAAHEPLFGAPLVVGLLYALLNLAAAPLSRRVPALVARVGRRPLFWGMPLMLGLSLVLMAWVAHAAAADPGRARWLSWCGVAMFFLQQIPFGMHWALVQEFVNHRIGPAARSTVWSVLSLGGRLCYAPLNQQLFALQAAHGTPATLGSAGGIGVLVASAVLLLRPRGLLRGERPAAAGDGAPVSDPDR